MPFDSAGNLLTPLYNADLSGGFEAMHVDDRSICEQVTHDGVVWVDDRQCQMGEAKFGGVFVGITRWAKLPSIAEQPPQRERGIIVCQIVFTE